MRPDRSESIAIVAILGILAFLVYRFALWVAAAKRTADPWDEETEKAVQSEGAVPLCHHCLTPQEHNGWFCPQCGATVGPYCNYLPYIYIFSQGEVLRAGVSERMRHNKLITFGYILFTLGAYMIFAPLYWFFFFERQRQDEAVGGGTAP